MSAEHADERLWRAVGPGGGDMATVQEALAAGASVDVCRERGGLTFGVLDRVLLCRPKAWAKLLDLLYDRGLSPDTPLRAVEAIMAHPSRQQAFRGWERSYLHSVHAGWHERMNRLKRYAPHALWTAPPSERFGLVAFLAVASTLAAWTEEETGAGVRALKVVLRAGVPVHPNGTVAPLEAVARAALFLTDPSDMKEVAWRQKPMEQATDLLLEAGADAEAPWQGPFPTEEPMSAMDMMAWAAPVRSMAKAIHARMLARMLDKQLAANHDRASGLSPVLRL